jgi:RNA-binding protein NOB1
VLISAALMAVIAFAKKTGDFAVLSQTDLGVIGLTYQYEAAVNGEAHIRTELGRRIPTVPTGQNKEGETSAPVESKEDSEESDSGDEAEGAEDEAELSQSIEQVMLDEPKPLSPSSSPSADPFPPRQTANETTSEDFPELTANPATGEEDTAKATSGDEDSDDGGEWITPSNVSHHKSHDLGLLPDESSSTSAVPLAAACMTGDFAVQNVLLGMGLGLVGEGGRKISKVRSWVLRCHACFK